MSPDRPLVILAGPINAAGHANLDSTMRYIHLSGRDLSDELSRGLAQIHEWRVGMLTEQSDAAAAGVMSSEPG